VYRDGRPDLAATWGMAALRAAVLFGAAAFAYAMLKKRFLSAPA
jgi:hypothetical protein